MRCQTRFIKGFSFKTLLLQMPGKVLSRPGSFRLYSFLVLPVDKFADATLHSV